MEISSKLDIDLPYERAASVMGIYPEDMNILCQRDSYTTIFIAALFKKGKI